MNALNYESGKRKYPRIHFRRPVTFTCKGYSEVALGMEIGEGGIAFQTGMALELGNEVVVNFYIPGGSFFCLRAIVKNTNAGVATKAGQSVYGASFSDVSLTLKRQIRAYVARTSHEQDKFKVPA